MASEIETILRYDGPALAEHEMDVEELAPALLALASLIQTANHKFNGDRSAVRVVVNADVEQQCFQIKIKLIQDFLSVAKNFLDGDMATIKDILEWVGILGTGGGLLKLLIALGKKQQDATVFTATANDDSTVIQIAELNVHLPPGTPLQVEQLLRNPLIVSKAKEVLKPVTQKGYETISFHEPGKGGRKFFEADSEEARAALAYELPTPSPELDQENTAESTMASGPAWVDTSHFRGNAKWALMWNGIKIDAKMPEDFVRRFQANETLVVPNTKLTVRMKIVPNVDQFGKSIGVTSYIVEEVLGIELPPKAETQARLFDDQISGPDGQR